jgi:mannosyltransferase OCH1-like enzyme
MIPRTIHYCWFGNQPMPESHRRYIEGWQALMPDYRFVFWNEENAPMDRAYLQRARAARRWVNLSNFIRLYSVYHEGGIYLDTDVEVVRRLDPLLVEAKCFFGYQIASREPAENSVNNAVFGAEPNHPFVKKMLDAIEVLYDGLETEYLSGPHLSTFMLRSHGILDEMGEGATHDVRVFPHHYFYPYSWLETYHPDCVQKDTYAIHHWAALWGEPEGPTARFAAVRSLAHVGKGKLRRLFGGGG